MTVALNARVRGRAHLMRVHIRVNDMVVEIFSEIEHQMVDAQLLGDASRVVDIAD